MTGLCCSRGACLPKFATTAKTEVFISFKTCPKPVPARDVCAIMKLELTGSKGPGQGPPHALCADPPQACNKQKEALSPTQAVLLGHLEVGMNTVPSLDQMSTQAKATSERGRRHDQGSNEKHPRADEVSLPVRKASRHGNLDGHTSDSAPKQVQKPYHELQTLQHIHGRDKPSGRSEQKEVHEIGLHTEVRRISVNRNPHKTEGVGALSERILGGHLAHCSCSGKTLTLCSSYNESTLSA